MRLGLYELRRPKEAADDWVWIMDHTVQLGPWKCLVIVGVRLSAWRRKEGPLEHEDLTLLNLTPMEQSSGEAVAAQLRETKEESGIVPAAVLSDEGAELKKAMVLFREESPELQKVPHVYDIKHKVATILKKELHQDKTWQSFVTRTNRTKLRVTLTELAFLVPPGLKNKARYMNLDTLVDWGCRVLAYLDDPCDFPGQKVDRKKLRQKLGWLRRVSPAVGRLGRTPGGRRAGGNLRASGRIPCSCRGRTGAGTAPAGPDAGQPSPEGRPCDVRCRAGQGSYAGTTPAWQQ